MKRCMTAIKIRRRQIVSVTALVLVIIAGIIGLAHHNNRQIHFHKPYFEQNVKAVSQIDTTDKSFSVLQVAQNYQVGLCGQPKQTGQELAVCFTNLADNRVWLQLFLYDDSQKLLASTGLVKPGEGIAQISLKRRIKVTEPIHIQVAGYEPETFYSLGEMNFQTTIRE